MLDRHLLKIGFALGFAASLAAKQSPPTPVPTIILNVAALDSHGQPVKDLRAEDVQVIDNGKPLPVVWLRSLPATTPEPRATFILIDLLNNDFKSRGLAENEVVEALTKVESGANVYLYLLTPKGTIFPVHGVSASSVSAGDGQWTQHVKTSLDEALRQVDGLKAGNLLAAYNRIAPTWSALSQFEGQLEQVPGPKSFVWITQGVLNGFLAPDYSPRFVESVTPLRDFSDVLNALETSIYTVQQKPDGSLELDNTGSFGDTLNQLSALTGGQSFSTDSAPEAIAQAMSGAQRMNYRLGFSPEKVDGKYHKIHLTSARGDIKFQTADRYYGSGADPERNLTARDPDKMLAGILSGIGRSRFDFPEIGVRASLADSTVMIHVDGHDVLFLHEGPRYKAELSVAITEPGSNWAMRSTGPLAVSLDLGEDGHTKALTEGIDIPRPLAPGGATRQVRVTVVDHNSYLVGTSTIPTAGN
jgi:VWFA-related protein